MDDALIVALYWQRDEQAIEETTRKYAERLRWIAQNILQDTETVKECENDTYGCQCNIEYLCRRIAKIVTPGALNCTGGGFYRKTISMPRRIPTMVEKAGSLL